MILVEKKNNNIITLMILYLGYFLVYADKKLIGFLIIPINQEFNLAPEQSGLILSIFFLSYTFSYPLAGFLNDRINSKYILATATFLIGISSISLGFATTVMIILVCRFLIGIFHGGYPVSCTKVVATIFKKEHRTFAQSSLLSSMSMVAFIIPILAAFLIGNYGWRFTIGVLGGAFVLVGVVVMLFLQVRIQPKASSNYEKQNNNKEEKIPAWQIIKNKDVLLLLVCLFFINVVVYGISSWVPTYLNKEKGLSLEDVGIIFSLIGFIGFFASIAGGYILGEYLENKENILVFILSIASAVLAIALVFIDSIAGIIIDFGILFFFLQMIFITIFTWPLRKVSKSVVASVSGFSSMGGAFGGFVASYIIGIIVMHTGSYNGVFVMFGISLIITAISMLFITNKKGKISFNRC